MPVSDATIKRIQKRVEEFHKARKLIEIRIDEYIKEYEECKGKNSKMSALYIQEILQHLFVPNEEDEKYNKEHNIETKEIPKFTRLLWEGDDLQKPPLWQKADIAIAIGKVRQTGSDFLGEMEKSAVWRKKLKNCRVPPGNETPPHRYSVNVFNVILDFYEEGAMQTYFKPSNGKPKTQDDRDEIKKIWEETKKSL